MCVYSGFIIGSVWMDLGTTVLLASAIIKFHESCVVTTRKESLSPIASKYGREIGTVGSRREDDSTDIKRREQQQQ